MSLRNDITDGLHAATKLIKTQSGYDIHFEETSGLIVNLADLTRHRTPLLEIIDGGNEEKLVETSTGQLYRWDLILRGSSRVRENDIHEELNKILSTLKQWAFTVTPSTIHANVLNVKFQNVSAAGLVENTEYAAMEVGIRILYHTVGDY